jgi:hypothetical protein
LPRPLELTGFSRTRHRLAYTATIAGHSFTSRFRYDSIDLLELERRHGTTAMRSLYFHAIAFDLNRLISLEPDTVAFGPLSDLVTAEFSALWLEVFRGVWAQWRYQNNRPDYRGPRILGGPAPPAPSPLLGLASAATATVRSLIYCGGGKDSLLAAKLFEEIGEPFDSFGYSHSIYGAAEPQHALIDKLLDHCAPVRRHRLWIDDDFHRADLDLAELGVETITTAETPAALFLALPLALAHGFENLVVAHERSADSPNLVWQRTGEEVNHQWGKSLEAETLLGTYVERHLLPGARYFSALKPIRDTVIFPALRDYAAAIPHTHSCNVAKPWCGRCPKCLYVFLGYAAWLPRELVLETFGDSLFDVEENLAGFAALLGLEGHLPFECVGQADESRLALALAARRGWRGIVVERFCRAEEADLDPLARERLHDVAVDGHRIPEDLRAGLLGALSKRAEAARRSINPSRSSRSC